MSSILSEGYVAVTHGHEIYYAEFGNPHAPAAVVLHGGPGSSSHVSMLKWFDLSRWRVVLFDQRGCGKSRPSGSLENNLPGDLIDDIERLRSWLDIDSWVVVGGSWGAYLGLEYAARHGDVVRHLVLRGVFLPSRLQIDWFFQQLRALVPQAWEDLTHGMSEKEKENVLPTLSQRLLGNDTATIAKSAASWGQYEDVITNAMLQRGRQQKDARAADSHLSSQQDETKEKQAAARRIDKFRIQAHYLENLGAKDRPAILSALHSISCATTLIHGTHDWICPPANAVLVQQSLRKAQIRWVEGGTHTTSDALICRALSETLAALAEKAS